MDEVKKTWGQKPATKKSKVTWENCKREKGEWERKQGGGCRGSQKGSVKKRVGEKRFLHETNKRGTDRQGEHDSSVSERKRTG